MHEKQTIHQSTAVTVDSQLTAAGKLPAANGGLASVAQELVGSDRANPENAGSAITI
jgi:hypothetical protein